MERKYELSTGILECYPLYAIFHFNAPFYDRDEAKEFVQTIDTHYKNRKCVVISNREMAKNVNPEVYNSVKSKCVIGIAIVSNSEIVKKEAYNEQGLFEGAFSYFGTIEEAEDWAKTVISDY
ncbi:hypothetical protein [Aequorivita lipolytica]|uniref:Thymidylate synthase n=1 Tax=Aequorivita lipolytica TaxID=153267 RepID=A0A5C6YSQ5_9FLAO|nr:hypothetical protein [Aequorivita lipolytica]TXD69998.1 hypothetical protein ESV24_06075 [Aequorivita lipolytica]SRX50175.1 hypothetical protein AEQU2_00644 [Aequorivita lipolytica]